MCARIVDFSYTIMFKKYSLKIWPYLTSALSGLIVYLFVINSTFDKTLSSLLINISAALFAIPLLFIIYELAQKYSKRKLNKELIEYGKLVLDTEILSLINQLQKLIYNYEEQKKSFDDITVFLSLNVSQIKNIASDKELLGFQIFKQWDEAERGITEKLNNSLLVQKLDDEQLIPIIRILKKVNSLQVYSKKEDIFERIDKTTEDYVINSGKEISKYNDKLPDRLLLLKKLGGDKYMVQDFGDFKPFNHDKLLHYWIIKEEHAKVLSRLIGSIIEDINEWLNETGDEFLIDNKMFKIHSAQSKSK